MSRSDKRKETKDEHPYVYIQHYPDTAPPVQNTTGTEHDGKMAELLVRVKRIEAVMVKVCNSMAKPSIPPKSFDTPVRTRSTTELGECSFCSKGSRMLFIFQNIELDNVVVKDIVNGAVDLELNFQAGQTGNSVANAGACLGVSFNGGGEPPPRPPRSPIHKTRREKTFRKIDCDFFQAQLLNVRGYLDSMIDDDFDDKRQHVMALDSIISALGCD